jgi:multidrug resistance efflux pump
MPDSHPAGVGAYQRKENQLYGMRIGQPLTFTVDALRGAAICGHIEEFSPATGSECSVVRADNPTGNFTKVAQLAPGMSVVVSVDTAARPEPSRVAHLDQGAPDLR